LAITKARAWLDGEDEVTLEHLVCLTSVLWRDVKEEKAVQRIVFRVACPLYLQALEMEDAASDLVAKLPKTEDPDDPEQDRMVQNVLMQLNDMVRALKDEIARAHPRNRPRAQASLTKIAGYHTQVAMALKAKLERLGL
jgi:hypothetical protein